MFWAAWNWFCSSKPLQYIGWSYSKVVIPVADFTLRFFIFCFHCDWRRKEKSWQIIADLSASGKMVVSLHRRIVNFTEGVDCILFQAVNNMEVSLSHLYGGVSEETWHRFYIRSFGKDVHRKAVPGAMPCDFLPDACRLYPFTKIQVTDVVMREFEYTFIKVVVIRLADQTDKGVVQRNDYPASAAVVFCLLLLEPQCLGWVIHIAVGQLACVAPTHPGV